MSAKLGLAACLMSALGLAVCLLPAAQVDRTGWPLAPQLSRGQELVYSGLYKEQSLIPGVNYQREYLLQTRMIVLDATPDGWQAALLTALEQREEAGAAPPAKGQKSGKASYRLELAKIDKQGQPRSLDNNDLALTLDGLPTLERGFLIPVPLGSVVKHQEWLVSEPGRPSMVWRILGPDVIGGIKCLKLEAEQASLNWKSPSSAQAAWQRIDRVWVTVPGAMTLRLEREIKHREPARTAPTHGSVLRYDLDRQWTYPPGTLFESRHQDILNAAKFGREAETLLAQHLQNKGPLDLLLKRIDNYVAQRQPVEPFGRVMEQIRHRVEAVRRGEILIQPQPAASPLIPVAALGQRSPDFLVTDVQTKQGVQLYKHLGRPILLVFYNPHTVTGARTVQFAKRVKEDYQDRIVIFGMAVTNDTAGVVKQCQELALPFPVLDGTGLHHTFAVDATPRVILLDAKGFVCGTFTGWGFHVPDQILAEVHKCCPPKKVPDPQP